MLISRHHPQYWAIWDALLEQCEAISQYHTDVLTWAVRTEMDAAATDAFGIDHRLALRVECYEDREALLQRNLFGLLVRLGELGVINAIVTTVANRTGAFEIQTRGTSLVLGTDPWLRKPSSNMRRACLCGGSDCENFVVSGACLWRLLR